MMSDHEYNDWMIDSKECNNGAKWKPPAAGLQRELSALAGWGVVVAGTLDRTT